MKKPSPLLTLHEQIPFDGVNVGCCGVSIKTHGGKGVWEPYLLYWLCSKTRRQNSQARFMRIEVRAAWVKGGGV